MRHWGLPPIYRNLGIDVNDPNPDGSDYHLMDAVDDMRSMWMSGFIYGLATGAILVAVAWLIVGAG